MKTACPETLMLFSVCYVVELHVLRETSGYLRLHKSHWILIERRLMKFGDYKSRAALRRAAGDVETWAGRHRNMRDSCENSAEHTLFPGYKCVGTPTGRQWNMT